MTKLAIRNPFPGATAFSMSETDSTMAEAKRLSEGGFVSGSVVTADFQTSGRGRIPGRTWESAPGENLLCTILIMRPIEDIPAFPLKVGLACARAINSIKAELGNVEFDDYARVKWPNDIILGGKKAAGILCEAREGALFAGIGINVNQSSFSPELEDKATSLKLVYRTGIDRLRLLEIVLEMLAFTLSDPDWKIRLESLLWKRGGMVAFREGAAEADTFVHGTIAGIADDGHLLLVPLGETIPKPYAAGEILMDYP